MGIPINQHLVDLGVRPSERLANQDIAWTLNLDFRRPRRCSIFCRGIVRLHRGMETWFVMMQIGMLPRHQQLTRTPFSPGLLQSCGPE